MTPRKPGTQQGLNFEQAPEESETILADGAVILHRFAFGEARELLDAVEEIAAKAPFRHMVTPGGFRMSAAMTNCGEVGWVSDRDGYRYDATDPETGRRWPNMPELFRRLATNAAEAGGFSGFEPDACLINRYEPGARLTLHQDRNEQDFAQPIVSFSLGLPAVFLFGGLKRRERPRRIRLESGDVVVWGGPSRLFYHGVAELQGGVDEVAGERRVNLTFRKAR